MGWARQGSINAYRWLFVSKVIFLSKKVTVVWQDSKIPNEIPLRAFAPLVPRSAKVRLALLAQDDTQEFYWI